MRKFSYFWLLLAMVLSACGPAKPSLTVEGAWARPSPMDAMNGAFYLTIRNRGSQPDRLIGAASPACGMVELHESYMMEGGAMGMRPLAGGIEVPANGTVEFKPGGLHIMCMHIQEPFKPGNRVPLTLRFEQAGELQVEVEVREQ